jgi:hypothetical protein
MTIDSAGWVAVLLALLFVAGQLLVLTPVSRRGNHGVHAKTDRYEPQDRRKAWHELRTYLLLACGMASYLLVDAKHVAAARLLALVIVGVATSEIRAWLALTSPAARRAAWLGLSVAITAVSSELLLVFNLHGLFRWALLVVFFVVIAPDLDSRFRAWQRRRNNCQTDDG